MPQLKSQSSPEEIANYLTQGLNLDKVLGDAIALLNARKIMSADGQETRLITAQVGQLEAEQAKASAELLAFAAEQLRINPPTDAQVTDMENRSKSLDVMTANAATTNGILALTKDALNDWNQTRA